MKYTQTSSKLSAAKQKLEDFKKNKKLTRVPSKSSSPSSRPLSPEKSSSVATSSLHRSLGGGETSHAPPPLPPLQNVDINHNTMVVMNSNDKYDNHSKNIVDDGVSSSSIYGVYIGNQTSYSSNEKTSYNGHSSFYPDEYSHQNLYQEKQQQQNNTYNHEENVTYDGIQENQYILAENDHGHLYQGQYRTQDKNIPYEPDTNQNLNSGSAAETMTTKNIPSSSFTNPNYNNQKDNNYKLTIGSDDVNDTYKEPRKILSPLSEKKFLPNSDSPHHVQLPKTPINTSTEELTPQAPSSSSSQMAVIITLNNHQDPGVLLQTENQEETVQILSSEYKALVEIQEHADDIVADSERKELENVRLSQELASKSQEIEQLKSVMVNNPTSPHHALDSSPTSVSIIPLVDSQKIINNLVIGNHTQLINELKSTQDQSLKEAAEKQKVLENTIQQLEAKILELSSNAVLQAEQITTSTSPIPTLPENHSKLHSKIDDYQIEANNNSSDLIVENLIKEKDLKIMALEAQVARLNEDLMTIMDPAKETLAEESDVLKSEVDDLKNENEILKAQIDSFEAKLALFTLATSSVSTPAECEDKNSSSGQPDVMDTLSQAASKLSLDDQGVHALQEIKDQLDRVIEEKEDLASELEILKYKPTMVDCEIQTDSSSITEGGSTMTDHSTTAVEISRSRESLASQLEELNQEKMKWAETIAKLENENLTLKSKLQVNVHRNCVSESSTSIEQSNQLSKSPEPNLVAPGEATIAQLIQYEIQIKELSLQRDDLIGKLMHLAQQFTTMRQQNGQTIEQLQLEIQNLTEEKNHLEHKIEAKSKELEQVEQLYSSEKEELKYQIKLLVSERDVLMKELEEVNTKVKTLEEKLKDSEQSDMSMILESLRDLTDQSKEQKQVIAYLQAEASVLTAQIVMKDEELAVVVSERDELKTRLADTAALAMTTTQVPSFVKSEEMITLSENMSVQNTTTDQAEELEKLKLHLQELQSHLKDVNQELVAVLEEKNELQTIVDTRAAQLQQQSSSLDEAHVHKQESISLAPIESKQTNTQEFELGREFVLVESTFENSVQQSQHHNKEQQHHQQQEYLEEEINGLKSVIESLQQEKCYLENLIHEKDSAINKLVIEKDELFTQLTASANPFSCIYRLSESNKGMNGNQKVEEDVGEEPKSALYDQPNVLLLPASSSSDEQIAMSGAIDQSVPDQTFHAQNTTADPSPQDTKQDNAWDVSFSLNDEWSNHVQLENSNSIHQADTFSNLPDVVQQQSDATPAQETVSNIELIANQDITTSDVSALEENVDKNNVFDVETKLKLEQDVEYLTQYSQQLEQQFYQLDTAYQRLMQDYQTLQSGNSYQLESTSNQLAQEKLILQEQIQLMEQEQLSLKHQLESTQKQLDQVTNEEQQLRDALAYASSPITEEQNAQVLFLKNHVSDLESSRQLVDSEIQSLRSEMNQLNSQLQETNQMLNDKEQDSETLLAKTFEFEQLVESLKTQLESAQRSLQEKERLAEETAQSLLDVQDENELLSEKLNDDKNQLTEYYETKIEEFERTLQLTKTELETKIYELENERFEKESQLTSSNERASQLEQDMVLMQEKLAASTNQYELQSYYENRIKELEQSMEQEQVSIQEKLTTLDTMSLELKEKKQRVSQLEEEINTLQIQFSSATNMINEVTNVKQAYDVKSQELQENSTIERNQWQTMFSNEQSLRSQIESELENMKLTVVQLENQVAVLQETRSVPAATASSTNLINDIFATTNQFDQSEFENLKTELESQSAKYQQLQNEYQTLSTEYEQVKANETSSFVQEDFVGNITQPNYLSTNTTTTIGEESGAVLEQLQVDLQSKAVEIESLMLQVADKEQQLYAAQYNLQDFETNNQQLQEEIDMLMDRFSQIADQMSSLSSDKTNIENERNLLQEQAADLQSQIDNLLKLNTELKHKNGEAESAQLLIIEKTKEKITSLTGRIDELVLEKDQLVSSLEQKSSEIATLESELANAVSVSQTLSESSQQETQQLVANYQSEVSKLISELEDVQLQYQETYQELGQLRVSQQERFDTLSNELQFEREQVELLRKELDDQVNMKEQTIAIIQQTEMEHLQQLEQKKNEEIHVLEAQLQTIQIQMDDLHNEMNTMAMMKKEEESLVQKVQSLQHENSLLEDRLKKELLGMEENYQDQVKQLQESLTRLQVELDYSIQDQEFKSQNTETLRADVLRLEQLKQTLEERVESLVQEIEQVRSGQRSEMQLMVENFTAVNESNQTKLDDVNRLLESVVQEKNTLEAQVDQMKQTELAYQAKLQALDTEKTVLFTQLEQQLEDLKNSVHPNDHQLLQNECRRLEDCIVETEKQVKTVHENYKSELEMKTSQWEDQLFAKQNQLDEVSKRYNTIVHEREESDTKLKNALKQVSSLETTLQQAEERYQQAAQQVSTLNTELSVLRQQYDEAVHLNDERLALQQPMNNTNNEITHNAPAEADNNTQLQAEIQELNSALEHLATENHILMEELKEKKEKLASQEVGREQELVKQLTNELQLSQQQVRDLNSDLMEFRQKQHNPHSLADVNAKQLQIDQLGADLKSKEMEVEKLLYELEEVRSSSNIPVASMGHLQKLSASFEQHLIFVKRFESSMSTSLPQAVREILAHSMPLVVELKRLAFIEPNITPQMNVHPHEYNLEDDIVEEQHQSRLLQLLLDKVKYSISTLHQILSLKDPLLSILEGPLSINSDAGNNRRMYETLNALYGKIVDLERQQDQMVRQMKQFEYYLGIDDQDLARSPGSMMYSRQKVAVVGHGYEQSHHHQFNGGTGTTKTLSMRDYANLMTTAQQVDVFKQQFLNSQILMKEHANEIQVLKEALESMTRWSSTRDAVQSYGSKTVKQMEELKRVWHQALQANAALRTMISDTQKQHQAVLDRYSQRESRIREELEEMIVAQNSTHIEMEDLRSIVHEKECLLMDMVRKHDKQLRLTIEAYEVKMDQIQKQLLKDRSTWQQVQEREKQKEIQQLKKEHEEESAKLQEKLRRLEQNERDKQSKLRSLETMVDQQHRDQYQLVQTLKSDKKRLEDELADVSAALKRQKDLSDRKQADYEHRFSQLESELQSLQQKMSKQQKLHSEERQEWEERMSKKERSWLQDKRDLEKQLSDKDKESVHERREAEKRLLEREHAWLMEKRMITENLLNNTAASLVASANAASHHSHLHPATLGSANTTTLHHSPLSSTLPLLRRPQIVVGGGLTGHPTTVGTASSANGGLTATTVKRS